MPTKTIKLLQQSLKSAFKQAKCWQSWQMGRLSERQYECISAAKIQLTLSSSSFWNGISHLWIRTRLFFVNGLVNGYQAV